MPEKIGGYRVIEQIAETRGSVVYRARKEGQDETVVIKVLKAEFPTPAEVARFKKEYESIRQADIDGVVRALEIIPYRRSFALVLEDFGGISLKEYQAGQPLPINDFLDMAVSLAGTLGKLHERLIVHRDIKPLNIIFNPRDKQVKITDFGIISELTGEREAIFHPDVISGTLLYMSPEQTGRMNRPVDYRTDFYSLGITFYHMLTGRQPFISEDPLEIIHAHIARRPQPPEVLAPHVPSMISRIVLKLLSKNAEDRYQNSYGLMADLEQCREQFQETGMIEMFELGRHDIPLMFNLPQYLYGREHETAILVEAFERIAQGGREIIHIVGQAGIGKSALIQELYKPITARRGYFTSGKYEQFRQEVPYSALVQAFQRLIRQVLSEDEPRLGILRQRMREALGPNGKIITDIFPELELLIGKQPNVPILDPEGNQNRFRYILRHFIQLFSTSEHPLVLALDDLQWADSASLALIQNLMMDDAQRYLLLITTYRDAEGHTLDMAPVFLERLRAEGVPIQVISLEPLTVEHGEALLADFLRCPHEKVYPLAEIVHAKTGGNPFFISQFLRTLHEEQVLRIDPAMGWEWDLPKIMATSVTDNVVELLTRKISNLSANALDIIKVCAVIGARSDLDLITNTVEKDIDETLDGLSEAMVMGFISRSETTYQFSHDRIQETTYALIPEEKRLRLHYRIGSLFIQQTPESELGDTVFATVNQLNAGLSCITSAAERTTLARLNLMAAEKAMNTSAFASALVYAKAGIALLPDDAWSVEYDTTYGLFINRMQCEYLCLHYREAQELFGVIVKKARTLPHKARAYFVVMSIFTNLTRYEEAIALGSECVGLLGIPTPAHPSRLRVLLALFEAWRAMGGRRLEDLLGSPDIQDPTIQEYMKVSYVAATAAYFLNPNFFALSVTNNMTAFIRHGNTEMAPITFVTFAAMLGPGLDMFKPAFRLAGVARMLMQRYPHAKDYGMFVYLNAFLLQHWQGHARNDNESYRLAHRLCLANGNLLYAYHAITALGINRITIGDNLDEILAELGQYQDIHKWVDDAFILSVYQENIQFCFCLKDLTKGRTDLDDQGFDTEGHFIQYRKTNNRLGIFYLSLKCMGLQYLFGEYSRAYKTGKEMAKIADVALATPQIPEFYFYYALSMAALHASVTRTQRLVLRMKIKRCLRLMKKWAAICPENFHHKELLMRAELVRIEKRFEEAGRLFNLAIVSAKENAYTQNEGIAHELAARFYEERGHPDLVKNHINAARRAYLAWGATAKVSDLEARYPELMEKTGRTKKTGEDSSGKDSKALSLEGLDLRTVLKISHTISGEIDLDRLIKRLLDLALENAGAQLGALLLEREGGLKIEAMASLDDKGAAASYDSSGAEKSDLPQSVINYVRRTGTYLILDNAVDDQTFGQDPGIIRRGIRSVLCLPIKEQQRLIGMLYLENNLSEKAFPQDRVEILEIMTSQAAISVKNAMLYSERIKMEEELLKAQKLESLSIFAGGIAHDFNNLLTGILGNASLLLMQTPPDSPQYKRMLMLEKASLRAKDLTQQLLTFAKGGNPIKKTTSIVDLLRESTQFALSGTPIKCEFSLQQGLWPLEVDEGQISQVINNLLINASHAMPQGGIVTIAVQNVTIAANSPLPLKHGEYVRITVQDQGIGIPPENLPKIFDPFFTTKPKGNGLGLSSTYSIIQKHDGHIAVTSEVGVGTTFTIHLPASHDKDIHVRREADTGLLVGSGRVLLMDDEDIVRETGGEILRQIGFEVDCASDGWEAIEMCRAAAAAGRPYVLVICDLTVPAGLGGKESIPMIRAIDDKVKIIASSGYSHDPVLSEFKNFGFDGIIVKPYHIGDMRSALQQVF